MLVVAGCLLWMGWFSGSIPYPPPLGWLGGTHEQWFVVYVVAAASAVASWFKPDRRHIQVTVSTVASLGILRGIAYALGGIWGPIGIHLLIAILAVGYYKARVHSRGFKERDLPQRLPGRW